MTLPPIDYCNFPKKKKKNRIFSKPALISTY